MGGPSEIEQSSDPPKYSNPIINHLAFLWEPIAPIENPFKLIFTLNRPQALCFTAAFLGWALDAFDYFLVVYSLPTIAKEFQVDNSVAATAITLTLAMRPVGAIIFGMAADKWGRRNPLMVDIIMYSLMGLLTGFAPNLGWFFTFRAFFGIAMGGEWGLGAALAMESLPPETRGLFSGILQQGYTVGHLIGGIFYYAVYTHLGWRPLFWIGSFPAVVAILIRLFVPESPTWKAQNEQRKAQGLSWFKETSVMFKQYWPRFIYCVLLMSCFNFLSHGSQDAFPTYLQVQLGYDPGHTTLATTISNIGAIVGGIIIGFYSQYIGRRRSIVICCILGACFIPLWSLMGDNPPALMAGAFFVQFFVQGAWGVIPVHLNELSPNQVRGIFPGMSYQLGNLISSSSAQIITSIGEQVRTADGKPDYGLTQGILTGVIFGCTLIMTILGMEYKGKDFYENEGVPTSNELSNEIVLTEEVISDTVKTPIEKV